MSTNQYGLDNDYFERKIAILHRDGLRNWTPDELARELARMSRTADAAVMREPEFSTPIIEQQKALIVSLRNDLQEAIAVDCDDDAKDACAEVERTGTPGSVIREMNDELVDLRARLAGRDVLLADIDMAGFGNALCEPSTELLARFQAALSASAEPSAPDCLTCSDHGAVGNILNAEPCPDCTQITKMEV
jgi:hypothetical protein